MASSLPAKGYSIENILANPTLKRENLDSSIGELSREKRIFGTNFEIESRESMKGLYWCSMDKYLSGVRNPSIALMDFKEAIRF